MAKIEQFLMNKNLSSPAYSEFGGSIQFSVIPQVGTDLPISSDRWQPLQKLSQCPLCPLWLNREGIWD